MRAVGAYTSMMRRPPKDGLLMNDVKEKNDPSVARTRAAVAGTVTGGSGRRAGGRGVQGVSCCVRCRRARDVEHGAAEVVGNVKDDLGRVERVRRPGLPADDDGGGGGDLHDVAERVMSSTVRRRLSATTLRLRCGACSPRRVFVVRRVARRGVCPGLEPRGRCRRCPP
jgi:hypothetical protein